VTYFNTHSQNLPRWAVKTFCQDRRSWDLESSPGPQEYEAGLLAAVPQRSVMKLSAPVQMTRLVAYHVTMLRLLDHKRN